MIPPDKFRAKNVHFINPLNPFRAACGKKCAAGTNGEVKMAESTSHRDEVTCHLCKRSNAMHPERLYRTA